MSDISNGKKGKIQECIKAEGTFQVGFMDIIPETAPKCLTSETTLSNYILNIDAYSKIPKLYGMDRITTEEGMEKLDMFQSRFVKVDEFGW